MRLTHKSFCVVTNGTPESGCTCGAWRNKNVDPRVAGIVRRSQELQTKFDRMFIALKQASVFSAFAGIFGDEMTAIIAEMRNLISRFEASIIEGDQTSLEFKDGDKKNGT